MLLKTLKLFSRGFIGSIAVFIIVYSVQLFSIVFFYRFLASSWRLTLPVVVFIIGSSVVIMRNICL